MTDKEMIENLKCVIADISAQCERLKAKNATSEKGEDKEVEFPVSFGDRIYTINFQKPKAQWKVNCGIVKTISLTQTPDRTRIVFRIKVKYRNGKEYVFGKNAFLSKEEAEARLAEMKGGEE